MKQPKWTGMRTTSKVRVYTLTEKQLADLKKQCTDTAVDYAFMYLVGMSIRVLHEQFGFGRQKRLPRFADALIDEYERYLSGEMTPDQYRDLIYQNCGVKFELTDMMEGGQSTIGQVNGQV